jgi:hypothetical protein
MIRRVNGVDILRDRLPQIEVLPVTQMRNDQFEKLRWPTGVGKFRRD